jgi:hypothetical protein
MSQEAFQTLADESKRAAELSKTKRPIKHLHQPAAEPRPVASQTRAPLVIGIVIAARRSEP